MAIKVRHDGNAAPGLTASAAGGKGKRQQQDSIALAQIAARNSESSNRQLQGARASAPGISMAHASLISASPGAGIGHASLPYGFRRQTAASANTPAAQPAAQPGVVRFQSGSSSSPAQSDDYKTTGTDIFNRPDDASQWDPGNGGRWIRKWLPGEKEAEAQKRIGMAQNEVYEDRQLTEQGRKERAALVGDITKAIKDGKFSQNEIPGLMREFGIAEDQIRMADALRDREPTAREQFMKNTFTDERGIIFSPDGKVLYNPQETELRRLDALRTRADNFEKELRKPRKITSTDENGVPSDNYVERTEDEISAIMQKRFPELYPASQVQEQTPTATPTPQNPVTAPDPAADNPGDPLAAFKKYKN